MYLTGSRRPIWPETVYCIAIHIQFIQGRLLMKHYLRSILLLFSLSCLCACSRLHVLSVADEVLQGLRLSHDSSVLRRSHWVLHPNTRIYLSGVSTTRPLHGHEAFQLTQAQRYLHSALHGHLTHAFSDVVSGPENDSPQAALHGAYEARADILVHPQIIRALDALNSIPERAQGLVFASRAPFGVDKFEIRINIYDVNSGQILDSTRVDGASHYLATDTMALHGLMRKIAGEYVNKISVPAT